VSVAVAVTVTVLPADTEVRVGALTTGPFWIAPGERRRSRAPPAIEAGSLVAAADGVTTISVTADVVSFRESVAVNVTKWDPSSPTSGVQMRVPVMLVPSTAMSILVVALADTPSATAVKTTSYAPASPTWGCHRNVAVAFVASGVSVASAPDGRDALMVSDEIGSPSGSEAATWNSIVPFSSPSKATGAVNAGARSGSRVKATTEMSSITRLCGWLSSPEKERLPTRLAAMRKGTLWKPGTATPPIERLVVWLRKSTAIVNCCAWLFVYETGISAPRL
jgi:hypothetical protein